MMLQPDSLSPELLNHPSRYSEYATAQISKPNSGAVESLTVDALVESLIPQGISPAKRAVIERLVTLWVMGVNLDAA